MTLFLLLLAGGSSWLLTRLVRHYAVSRHMVDVPTGRSSHTIPTPRGGGVAIAVTFTVAMLAFLARGAIPAKFAIALIGSGVVAASLGFIDDRGFVLSARVRLVGHFFAATWLLAWTGGVPPFSVRGWSIDLGLAGTVLVAVYLVWLLNLYNFMDGIDGIAGLEAITVALSGALVWWLATGNDHWVAPVVFAACVAGFLVLNFPPASIFMGDSGSCFIGMMLGGFSVWAGHEAYPLFWAWAILLGCFAVDATTTLLRRLVRGAKFDEAHRSHAYQYASRRHGGHRPVTLAYAAITLLWLLPMACLVALRHLDGVVGLLLAYAPLILMAYRYKAGAPDQQEV